MSVVVFEGVSKYFYWHGGQMLIPTYARTEPRVYFGRLAARDLVVQDRLIRFTMRAAGS